MLLDRVVQITRAPIVQEEKPLAKSPEGRSAELVVAGKSLLYPVREPGAHVVQHQVRKQSDRSLASYRGAR